LDILGYVYFVPAAAQIHRTFSFLYQCDERGDVSRAEGRHHTGSTWRDECECVLSMSTITRGEHKHNRSQPSKSKDSSIAVILIVLPIELAGCIA
jgi:hypothetical protein